MHVLAVQVPVVEPLMSLRAIKERYPNGGTVGMRIEVEEQLKEPMEGEKLQQQQW